MWGGSSLPESHCAIFTTSRKVPVLAWVGVPAQPEALFLVAQEFRLWRHNTIWSTAMFGSIEHQHSSIHAHCSNDVGILRLVPRFVDLTWVINLLLDVHFDCRLFARRRVSITADFSSLFVVVMGVGCNVFGQLNVGNLKIVLRTI